MAYLVLTTVESILFLIFVFYLVHEYSSKEVPFYIKLLTFISWILSFAVVIILPIDIYFVNFFRFSSENFNILIFSLEFTTYWEWWKKICFYYFNHNLEHNLLGEFFIYLVNFLNNIYIFDYKFFFVKGLCFPCFKNMKMQENSQWKIN